MIELVIFDLGRVLVRICNNWREAAELAGVKIPHDRPYADDTPDTAQRDHEAILLLDTGRIDRDEFARRVSATRGVCAEDVLRAYDIFLREPYPGAVELVEELRAAGVKTACLSNTSDGHWQQMCDRGHTCFFPFDRLDWAFASHQIGICKPDVAIYEYVERTARIAPESILFFDDLEANVAAAKRRGWNAHQIRIDADPIAQIRSVLREHRVLGPSW